MARSVGAECCDLIAERASRVPKRRERMVVLRDCRNLFKWLWPLVRAGEAMPPIMVSDDDQGLRQQMCHRAAIDDDPKAVLHHSDQGFQ